MKINRKLSNIVLENILNYENIENYDEIYKFLDKYDYEINEANKEKYNELCINLINKGFDIEKIIVPRIGTIINYIDPIINHIINSYFSGDEYNSFVLNYNNYFTDNQINFLFQECIKFTNNKDSYIENKIPAILEKVSNKYMKRVIEVFNNILKNNLISNNIINDETYNIFKVIKSSLTEPQKLEYVKNIINNCDQNVDSLKKINDIDVKLPIEVLEEINNKYSKNIDSSEIFNSIKTIFEANLEELKEKEKMYIYSAFFVNNISFSENIEEDIKLVEKNAVIDLTLLINKYLTNNFNANNEKYLISFLKNKISFEENDINYNDIINRELSDEQIEKLKLIIDELKIESIIKNIDFSNSNKQYYDNLLKLLEETNNNRFFFLFYKKVVENEGDIDLKKHIVSWLTIQKKIRFNKREKEELKYILEKEINESNDSDYINAIKLLQKSKSIPLMEKEMVNS